MLITPPASPILPPATVNTQVPAPSVNTQAQPPSVSPTPRRSSAPELTSLPQKQPQFGKANRKKPREAFYFASRLATRTTRTDAKELPSTGGSSDWKGKERKRNETSSQAILSTFPELGAARYSIEGRQPQINETEIDLSTLLVELSSTGEAPNWVGEEINEGSALESSSIEDGQPQDQMEWVPQEGEMADHLSACFNNIKLA